MRHNDTRMGATTATGRTGEGGSSKGPHFNSMATRLNAAPCRSRPDPEVERPVGRHTYSELQQQMADAKKKFAEEEKKLAEMKKEAQHLEREALRAWITALEEEKKAQNLGIEALRAQITVLEGRVARRTTQRDEFKCHLKTRDEDVARLEEEVKRLRGDLENVGHDVTTTTAQRDTLESLLKSRDEDVANLNEEVAHLRGDLESAHATIGELTSHRYKAEEVSPPSDDVALPVAPDEDVEVSKTVTLGAWAIPLTSAKDTSPATPPRPATSSQNIQAKQVATPRQTSSRRGDTENEA